MYIAREDRAYDTLRRNNSLRGYNSLAGNEIVILMLVILISFFIGSYLNYQEINKLESNLATYSEKQIKKMGGIAVTNVWEHYIVYRHYKIDFANNAGNLSKMRQKSERNTKDIPTWKIGEVENRCIKKIYFLEKNTLLLKQYFLIFPKS